MNATEHLLVCLNEECVEVAQHCCKSLRFGLDDRDVLNPTGPTNRERLTQELNDLMAVVEMLVGRRILPDYWQDEITKEAKKAKVLKFMNYAKGKGALI